jgi:hypothetical protein
MPEVLVSVEAGAAVGRDSAIDGEHFSKDTSKG